MSKINKDEAAAMVVEMSNALSDEGHVPLFLVGGKEIGEGYRNYTVAGATSRDHVLYVLKRLVKLFEGTANDVGGN